MEGKAVKTIDWYNKNAREYSRKSREAFDFSSRGKRFLDLLGKDNPDVLDAGCGDGRDSEMFRQSGAKVTATDISSGMLEVAKEDFREIDFVEGDIRSLPSTDENFDGVWSNASLVHLETLADVEQAVREFHRVLRSGGVVSLYVKKQTGENETEVVSDSLSGHDRFFRYYTMEQLEELLVRTGFTMEESYEEADQYGRNEVSWLILYARKK